jgi:glycosyltransferase involved in cell wall biosynthesis
MKPVVSIIVPCYNYAEYLPDALDSILAQTYTDWECIIINDGSRDNTEEAALNYCERDKRFKYFYKENGGHSSARNFGIRHSSGKYILPLDADDKICKELLEKSVEAIEKDSEIIIATSQTQLFGDVEKVIKMGVYDFKRLLIVNYLFATNLFRRADFEKTDGYDETMLVFEDWNLWINLLKGGGKVVELPFTGYYYRQKLNSVFRQGIKDDKRLFKDLLKLYINNIDVYEKYFENPISLIQENEKMKKVIANYQKTKTYKIGITINRVKKVLHLNGRLKGGLKLSRKPV